MVKIADMRQVVRLHYFKQGICLNGGIGIHIGLRNQYRKV